MVYTPKLVSQNKSYLVNNVNSSLSHQSSESGFNSSTQWLRRRSEQSQDYSLATEEDQTSPLLMRGKSSNILTSRARSTGFQSFNTLNPVYEVSSPTTPTTPTSPTSPTTASPQLQGLIGSPSRTPLQSAQFQPSPRIDATGSTIRNIQSTQDTSRPISFASTPQNATPFYQSQPRAYLPISQSNVAPINTPMYSGHTRTSDSTFGVGALSNRFERQSIPIYSSGTNIIGRDISGVNARISESPLVQSTPAPKPRHQKTPTPKVEKVPYLARLLIVEQELPKNEYEVEKSNSVKTLFFNFCLGIFITFLTSTKYFRRFENYTITNVIGYCMFCIPAIFMLRVFYINIQWNIKKNQIDQLREDLMKELEQNSSYDTSNFTISPPGRSQILSSPRSSRNTTTPSATITPSTVVSSIPTQSTTLPSTSTSFMSTPYTSGSASMSTILPSASSTSSFVINDWGSPGGTPFPQRIPPTTKYRQAPYVTPSKIDEKLITIGSISARLPPEPKPTDRET